jgi:hypothetical protein
MSAPQQRFLCWFATYQRVLTAAALSSRSSQARMTKIHGWELLFIPQSVHGGGAPPWQTAAKRVAKWLEGKLKAGKFIGLREELGE